MFLCWEWLSAAHSLLEYQRGWDWCVDADLWALLETDAGIHHGRWQVEHEEFEDIFEGVKLLWALTGGRADKQGVQPETKGKLWEKRKAGDD